MIEREDTVSHDETPPQEHTLDPWHTHTEGEPVPQAEHAAQINIGILLIVFAAMVFAIVVMVVGLTLFYNYSTANLRAERMENVVEYARQYKPYHETATAKIESYRQLDATERTVQIPVDRAAEIVAAAYAQDTD